MNESERDELLLRLDERSKGLSSWIHEWTQEHEQKHRDDRSYLHKWLGILLTFLGGVLIKVFWR